LGESKRNGGSSETDIPAGEPPRDKLPDPGSDPALSAFKTIMDQFELIHTLSADIENAARRYNPLPLPTDTSSALSPVPPL